MKITRRKITAATNTSKLASDKMLEAFETRLEELKVDSSTKVTASYSTDEEGQDNKSVEVFDTDADYIYKDVEGGFGEKDAEYTLAEIKQYWNNNYDSDPILEEYDDFNTWWEDTCNNFLIEV